VLESFLTDAECDHLVALGKRQVKLLTKMQPLLQAMAAGVLDENVDQDPGKMIEWRPCSAPDAVASSLLGRSPVRDSTLQAAYGPPMGPTSILTGLLLASLIAS
jgi:hypothetical protein